MGVYIRAFDLDTAAAVVEATPKEIRNFIQRAGLANPRSGLQGVRRRFSVREIAELVLAFDLFREGIPARTSGQLSRALLTAPQPVYLGAHLMVNLDAGAFLTRVDQEIRAVSQRVVAPRRGRPPTRR